MPILDRRTNQLVEDQDTRVSVGIDFPFGRQPNQDGYFKTTKTTVESVKNNIRLLLQTELGERTMQPFLGMNLRQFIFEQITEDVKVQIENKIKIDYLVGTMIELPRAAIKAEQIAKHADFFSFGTNDLTSFLLSVDRNNPRIQNIFNETDNKFCVVHNYGSYDWVCRSIENYKKLCSLVDHQK